MSRLSFEAKNILKDSIFGALFTLWIAPIDSFKQDISALKKPSKITNYWFLGNLIVGYKK